MKISLFTTCLTDTFFAPAAVAAVRLLRHLGCEVTLPPNQSCCGQAQYNNGFHRQARILALNTIDAFENSDLVVCPSASCTSMIRILYLQLFESHDLHLKRARSLAAKTYEFTEFITRILKPDLSKYNPKSRGKVTTHYSCHNRHLDLEPQTTVDLIRLIDGIEYIPLEKMDQCCGFGGTFAVKMPQISQALVADKVKCITDTGADTVVVNEGGCTLNIAGYCRKHNVNVRFVHIAQLLAESLGLMNNNQNESS